MADITKTTGDGETMMMIMVKTKVATKITKRKNSFIVTARNKKAGNFPSHDRKKIPAIFFALGFEYFVGIASRKNDQDGCYHVPKLHRNAPFGSFITQIVCFLINQKKH